MSAHKQQPRMIGPLIEFNCFLISFIIEPKVQMIESPKSIYQFSVLKIPTI